MNWKAKLLGLLLLFVVISVALFKFDVQWDVTSDQRYTIKDASKKVFRDVQQEIVVNVLFEGNVPPQLRNYKEFVDSYVSSLARLNNKIEVVYTDPLKGSIEEVRNMRGFLSERGVEPIEWQAQDQKDINVSLIYPFISVHSEQGIQFVNLLEPNSTRVKSPEEEIISSQLKFESKLTKAVKRLVKNKKSEVHIVGYQPDLLAEGYSRDPILGHHLYVPSNAEILLQRSDSLNAVVVVLKTKDLSREELLAVDYLSSKGTPIIWLVDKFGVTLDSLRETGQTFAIAKDRASEDFLFRFGCKLENKLIQSTQSTMIPQVVQEGNNSKPVLLPYPYHPLVITDESNPIETRLSNPVSMYYVSPIALEEYPKDVDKQVLLEIGPYTKLTANLIALDFRLMRAAIEVGEFQSGTQTIGVHLEGPMNSYFRNRLTKNDQALLGKYNKTLSTERSIQNHVVISDADFAIPPMDVKGSFYPVGFNPSERRMYDGNKELLSQLLESCIEGNDLLEMANQETALTVLDAGKFVKNKSKYYIILLGLPLVLLTLIYIAYHWFRKRKYAV